MMISQSGHVITGAGKPFLPGLCDEQPMAIESLSVGTHIVLLPVEPYRVHAYWDIAAADLKRVQDRFAENASLQSVLRIRDVTGPYQKTPRQILEREIDLHSCKCYIPISMPDRVYDAELGLRSNRGQFFSLVQSNEIRTPRAWPAESPADTKKAEKNRPFPLLTRGEYDVTGSHVTGGNFPMNTEMTQTGLGDVTSMNEAVFRTGYFSEQFFPNTDNNSSNND
jgi:hypothetical protein